MPEISTRDIQHSLQQVYRVAVLPDTISNIAESIMADVREWRNRPLEKAYPTLFRDARYGWQSPFTRPNKDALLGERVHTALVSQFVN